MNIEALKVIALVVNAFGLGFALANVIWVFHVNPSPKKGKKGKDKTSKADCEGND